MKRSFKLENLHCANCAAKMEEKINKLESVTAASIGFMSMRINIEADNMDLALESAQDAISAIEPDCRIVK
ncbi:MAG: heavy-metal-associated domain-containing protein [Anaerovoracaceae bacterium]